jgi:NADH-ubiquinone oxidoreductase chain 6
MINILITFLLFIAVFSAILVITAKNPVISVIFLISVFLSVATYLMLAMNTLYLGLVYIIVYVGAIAILFLFVIMMLNIKLVELIEMGHTYTQNLPLGSLIGGLFLFEFSTLGLAYTTIPSEVYSDIFGISSTFLLLLLQKVILGSHTVNSSDNSINVSEDSVSLYSLFNTGAADSTFSIQSQIESVGQALYGYSAPYLIIASAILLLAMVGPILLTLRRAH